MNLDTYKGDPDREKVPLNTQRSRHLESQRSEAPGSKRTSASVRSTMTDPGLFSKGMGNRSSMKENIITGGKNLYSGEIKPGILDA